jgi:hypothetical protein
VGLDLDSSALWAVVLYFGHGFGQDPIKNVFKYRNAESPDLLLAFCLKENGPADTCLFYAGSDLCPRARARELGGTNTLASLVESKQITNEKLKAYLTDVMWITTRSLELQ